MEFAFQELIACCKVAWFVADTVFGNKTTPPDQRLDERKNAINAMYRRIIPPMFTLPTMIYNFYEGVILF